MFFFFNDTATTEIYTLSLHDALPIFLLPRTENEGAAAGPQRPRRRPARLDRKSTRLNSSHLGISYAVFCLKKKTKGPHIPFKGHIQFNLPMPLHAIKLRQSMLVLMQT